MPSTHSRRHSPLRALRAAAVLSTLALAAACGDDEPTGEEEEPEIEALRLTVTPAGGTATTYTVTVNGGASPSPIQLRVGSATVSATALDGAGQAIDLGGEFELHVVGAVSGAGASQQTPLGNGLTFTANGTLSSTLVATAATAANVPAVVRLVHRAEAHSDFDAGVQLRVAAP